MIAISLEVFALERLAKLLKFTSPQTFVARDMGQLHGHPALMRVK